MKLERKHKIDFLGRILIPKELRAKLGADIGDDLALCYEDGIATMYLAENNLDDDSVISCGDISKESNVEMFLCPSCNEIKNANEGIIKITV
ncbi:MAG: AbrB/MazE/SpoVT family DNA-binding domain-containing protein [Defluviitaleaceae bacterium]|nr:AbrB/MazE/SpoVT family DNA-binding domain-containing protein [Defluviitaleaceae bacterium]